MWELIPLKEQSKIKMLQEFYKTNDPITINTLSEITQTSNRSVKNYLKELKESIKEIGGEFYSSTEGVNFKIPLHVGLDYFQKRLYRQSLGFTLLEKIFFKGPLTSEQLLKELYISQSTLNRLTKTINEALEPYGLQLGTSPYKIRGDEQVIRYFYTTYFVEAYFTNEWPFECLEKEIFDHLIPSSKDYYAYTSEGMNYTVFKFRIAVGVIRNMQGYSNDELFLKNKTVAAAYEETFAMIEKKVNRLSIDSIDERNSYVRELVDLHLFQSNQSLHNRLQNDQAFKQHLGEIKQLIDFLTEHFELPSDNQENLSIEMDIALSFFAKNKKNVQPKMYLLYPPRDYSLVKLYQRKYASFYDIVHYQLSLLCKKRGFEPSDTTLEYLIYVLISKWENLTKHLFSRYNAAVVKVHSHLSLRHAHNIAESLMSDLPSSIEVSVLEEVAIDEKVLSKYNFDILITTETLRLEIQQPVIYMYKSRSSYQFEELHNLIKGIAKRKDQRTNEDLIISKDANTLSKRHLKLHE